MRPDLALFEPIKSTGETYLILKLAKLFRLVLYRQFEYRFTGETNLVMVVNCLVVWRNSTIYSAFASTSKFLNLSPFVDAYHVEK